MRSNLIVLALLVLAGDVRSQAVGAPRADQIPMLDPASFPALPASVRHDLDRRGCRIPQNQEAGAGAPTNVVSGRFRSANQKDWAALCSRNGTSSLLIYWGGDARNAFVGPGSPDLHWMQWAGPAEGWHYMRYIATATPRTIRRLAAAFGDPSGLPTPLDHDGIEEGDAGKASVIQYWHQDRWIELTGMD